MSQAGGAHRTWTRLTDDGAAASEEDELSASDEQMLDEAALERRDEQVAEMAEVDLLGYDLEARR